ncbi:DUF1428 domain-containing protein [Zavarzinella formosa]|uniref:DUF1428 domain-containing protein n=1 Tax=Zavarzinella formosa TaxID=360055 RepID=UPI000319BD8A|nr:DUF1428 domain-containing protein [Zavarzinella formosa]
MGRYIDGFVIPVAKDRVEEYRGVAEKAALVWKEHGALDYWECVGDDLGGDDLCHGSFPQFVRAGADETVIFAWAVFESREHRDLANERIMADPRIKEMMDPDKPLFDFKRMAHGGFKELVHA